MSCKDNSCKKEFCCKAAKNDNKASDAPKAKCCAPKAEAPAAKKGCGC